MILHEKNTCMLTSAHYETIRKMIRYFSKNIKVENGNKNKVEFLDTMLRQQFYNRNERGLLNKMRTVYLDQWR